MSRPAYHPFPITVERAESVTPRTKRIVVDRSCLADFRARLPAQWLKVFAPAANGQAPSGRAYTVRRFDPASGRLGTPLCPARRQWPDLRVDGASQPGDAFEISLTHPRSGFVIDPATERYPFFSDETALPAVGAIVEALPVHARADVFVEVEDPARNSSSRAPPPSTSRGCTGRQGLNAWSEPRPRSSVPSPVPPSGSQGSRPR